MKCTCGGKYEVLQSRDDGQLQWRIRQCKICAQIVKTLEEIYEVYSGEVVRNEPVKVN